MPSFSVIGLALASAATVFIGYAFYFDYKRRSDPKLRRRIKREKLELSKLAAEKEAKLAVAESEPAETVDAMLSMSLASIFSKSPREKEAIFYTLLMKGEQWLESKTDAHNKLSVKYFHKAIQLIPSSNELLEALQKSLPATVFAMLLEEMRQDGLRQISDYYFSLTQNNDFIEMKQGHWTLSDAQVQSGYFMFAKKDIDAGQVLYREVPDVSSLSLSIFPDVSKRNAYCSHCSRLLAAETRSCAPCGDTYCSAACQGLAFENYHSLLCTKGEMDHPLNQLVSCCVDMDTGYPLMVVRFLATLICEEVKEIQAQIQPPASNEKENSKGLLYHYPYYKLVQKETEEADKRQMDLMKAVFSKLLAVSGDFISPSRYQEIKSMLMTNCIGFNVSLQQHATLHGQGKGPDSPPGHQGSDSAHANPPTRSASLSSFVVMSEGQSSDLGLCAPEGEWRSESSSTSDKENENSSNSHHASDNGSHASSTLHWPAASCHDRFARCALEDASSMTGYGLYPLTSHIGHSCDPNVKIQAQGSHEVGIVSTRKISKGEEIGMAYFPLHKGLSAHERRAHLKKHFKLKCTCSTCEAELRLR